MCCGYLLMPFWTFFIATTLGWATVVLRMLSPVFFSGKAMPQQLDLRLGKSAAPTAWLRLQQELQLLLAEAHQRMAQRIEELRPVEVVVSGLPEEMGPAEVEELVADFGAVESIEPWNRGEALVTFDCPHAAEKAASALDREYFRGCFLRCELRPRETPPEPKLQKGAVMVSNLPPVAR
ncbi:unnamed protein product [Effrenium voratum]|nr:unnamed protein product [Effrenium voratum]